MSALGESTLKVLSSYPTNETGRVAVHFVPERVANGAEIQQNGYEIRNKRYLTGTSTKRVDQK